nr:MAG TPA: hypothetical protein [Caudoviricetes sp.]
MGVCGTLGIKKWIKTQRHVFTGRFQGFQAVETGF